MKLKIILLVAGVALVLVWVGSVLAPRFLLVKKNEVANKTPSPTAKTTPPAVAPLPSPIELARLSEQTNLRVLAKNFAERYGSYSRDNNFENLELLKPLMTSNMVAYVNNIIAAGQQSKDFFSITTSAVNVSIEELTVSRATVRVKTVRQEIKGTAAPRVFNQELVLELEKVNGAWLVARARWQ